MIEDKKKGDKMHSSEMDNEMNEAVGTDTETQEERLSPEAQELAALKEENQQLKDQLLRTMAEMDNAHKRMMREKEEMQKYAITNFARDLLTIADTLSRALDNISEEDRAQSKLLATIYDGVMLTHNELMKVFSKFHIQILNPVGEKFDHNFHQAVSEIEDKEVEPGYIVQVLQVGYTIDGRLLRPAMVVVARR